MFLGAWRLGMSSAAELLSCSQIMGLFIVIMMFMVLRQQLGHCAWGINSWPAQERIDFV
jgi:hypothetical protein